MPAGTPADLDTMLDRVAQAVHDRRVLEAMSAVSREEFVPPEVRRYAYEDAALPIGHDQTISQPLMVGVMTEALALEGSERVLEVGTGSGYQAAILARLARDVVSVEIIDALREQATATLARLHVENVRLLPAGPVPGSPDYGPYDAIVVTAAAPLVPPALIDQLKPAGRLVIPIGPQAGDQELWLLVRTEKGVERHSLGGVRFVPLRGAGGFAVRGSGAV